jgi:hypothetical protein
MVHNQIGSAALQEATLYPKKKDDKNILGGETLYRDFIEPGIKKAFPEYYFEKLEKKSSKKNKYSGLPLAIQNSLLELERAGNR